MCARAAQLSLSFPHRFSISFRPQKHRRVSRRLRLRVARRKKVPRRAHSRRVGGQQVDRSSSPARGGGGGGGGGVTGAGRARSLVRVDSVGAVVGFCEGG